MELPSSRHGPDDTARIAMNRRRQQFIKIVSTVLISLFLIQGALLISDRQTKSKLVSEDRERDDIQKRWMEAHMMEEIQQNHHDSLPNGFRDEKRIVVLLTTERDPERCARTLGHALNLAYASGRVYFRVYEERSMTLDQSCLKIFCDLRPKECKLLVESKRLRLLQRDVSGGLGSSVAKHLVEGMVEKKLFRNHFYLSVDENIVFTKYWDLELLRQWYSIGNHRAVLSISPPAQELRGYPSKTVSVQCIARIQSKVMDAVVEFNPPEPRPKQADTLFSPILQSQYSEKFHFGLTSTLFDVRSDPHLSYMVVGHEYMRATRFWTSGVDFYAPSEDILYYRYDWPLTLQEREKVSDEIARSSRRIRKLLNLPVSITEENLVETARYGPGSKRLLTSWYKFSGIDPGARYNASTINQFVVCDEVLHYVHYRL